MASLLPEKQFAPLMELLRIEIPSAHPFEATVVAQYQPWIQNVAQTLCYHNCITNIETLDTFVSWCLDRYIGTDRIVVNALQLKARFYCKSPQTSFVIDVSL